MSKLQDLLGLPEARRASSNKQSEDFRQAFRMAMTALNRQLQVVAAQASKDEHRPLEAQKTRLYEAFQKASAKVDPGDPISAGKTFQRVIAAVTTVGEQASAVAAEVIASRDVWQEREGDYDDAMLRIGELEESEHAKAPVLRQLGDAIRHRVNGRKYQESLSAFEQLRPKLDEYYAEHEKQTDLNSNSQADLSGQHSPDDRNELWKGVRGA